MTQGTRGRAGGPDKETTPATDLGSHRRSASLTTLTCTLQMELGLSVEGDSDRRRVVLGVKRVERNGKHPSYPQQP